MRYKRQDGKERVYATIIKGAFTFEESKYDGNYFSYRMEFDKTVCGTARGIVTRRTVCKTFSGSLLCLSKTGHCTIICSKISSKFPEAVYCLPCMPPPHFNADVVKCPGY